jgi:hypothetical protein
MSPWRSRQPAQQQIQAMRETAHSFRKSTAQRRLRAPPFASKNSHSMVFFSSSADAEPAMSSTQPPSQWHTPQLAAPGAGWAPVGPSQRHVRSPTQPGQPQAQPHAGSSGARGIVADSSAHCQTGHGTPDPDPHPHPRFAGDRGWTPDPRLAGDRGSTPIPGPSPSDLPGIGGPLPSPSPICQNGGSS